MARSTRRRYNGIKDPTSISNNKFETEFSKITPRNENQRNALESLRNNILTIMSGPPGTAKTLLSTYVAYEYLNHKKIDRIIYCKPVVETMGERGLGFLPGDLDEKVYPHIAPIMDALKVFLSEGKVKYLVDKKIVEYMPLEHLRGQSLNRCFIICDEMQNAIPSVVFTLLTRVGIDSKIAILGDVIQRDLASRFGKDGLSDCIRRLEHSKDFAHIKFGINDCVRSPFVRNVLHYYKDLYS